MAEEQPRELANLLRATDPSSRESAWEKFLESYNRYILGTARFVAREYDGTMDCYRYVLEELRRDEFRRFRDYTARPTSRFSTWLVVVVRCLCHDFLRTWPRPVVSEQDLLSDRVLGLSPRACRESSAETEPPSTDRGPAVDTTKRVAASWHPGRVRRNT